MKTHRPWPRHRSASRLIFGPVMLWGYFKGMTDEDLKGIYTFVRTLPPVRQRGQHPAAKLLQALSPGARLRGSELSRPGRRRRVAVWRLV